MCTIDRGDQMLAISGLGLIIGPREGELSLICSFELDLVRGVIAKVR